jgi:hypothetical protein
MRSCTYIDAQSAQNPRSERTSQQDRSEQHGIQAPNLKGLQNTQCTELMAAFHNQGEGLGRAPINLMK